MTILQDILAAVGWQTRVTENFRSVSPAGLYGINPATTTGLTLGYLGGQFNGVTVADGTVALTASNTNYVVAHRTTGAVTAATNTTNWLNTTTYMQLYQLVASASTFTIASTSDKRQAFGAGAGASGNSVQCLAVACSDETTALTIGTAKITFINPFPSTFTVTGVVASLSTAQTFTVDINEAGSTILSTKLTIDNTEKNSSTAATPAVISDTSIAAYAEMTIDIDQIGDGTARGLKVYILGTV
jgi:hypothetical protein